MLFKCMPFKFKIQLKFLRGFYVMIVCMFICVLMLFGTSLIVNSFLDECVPVKKLKMSIVSGTLLVVLKRAYAGCDCVFQKQHIQQTNHQDIRSLA